ncbi:monosaccharide ABC transporter membrane protein (CUT2 family) [Actinocorallia herbida]|uniref:Autoinducer 2 import system permease protein LsrD n=1 Tax=Actinocorallia herbida TaxID=58109 RepID=A0A3N1CZ00_9ACTN|nr:ABC transporter permease [Actinocorallia herbida]ROO86514.1 monosaccharide ABC transporter membrane protein (CUT2 family) [Actinocorallia herbida]
MAPDLIARRAPALGKILRWDVLVGVMLVAVFGAGLGTNENFGNSDNIAFALSDLAEIALIALPMTLLVVCGEVDLSVASVLGLSSALTGYLWNAGWTFETIVPFVLVVGAICGLVNGLLVTKLGLPSLAVTIGTMTLYRGLAYVVLGTEAVSEFPQVYSEWATETVPGTAIPYSVALFIVLAIITGLLLHATGLGRSLFAIGNSEDAAFFAGIRVKRIKLILFVVTGFVAAFAGIVFTLRYGSARADNGAGLEMSVIAAVLLGGVDFDGGKGTLGGVIAGVLLIGVLRNLLMLDDVSTEVQAIVTGLLLVISVLAPRLAVLYREGRSRRRAVAEASASG